VSATKAVLADSLILIGKIMDSLMLCPNRVTYLKILRNPSHIKKELKWGFGATDGFVILE
tara:strand:+ start:66 stop:245 length:180 start_codon:yes stop_codon:yes gene_type:complete